MFRIVTSIFTLILFLVLIGPGANSPVAADSPHSYFDALVNRPEHWRSFSLRDQRQLETYADCKTCPFDVTYDPANDSDPRRQDAAKVFIPRNSLRNQVRVPMGTVDGTTYFVTWDVWFGREYDYTNHQMNGHKSFQFESSAIWFEVHTRFNRGKPDTIGELTGRAYNHGRRREEAFGPNITSLDPLPQVGTFYVKPETWTRYWVEIEQRASDYDLTSLWVSDENTNPIKILDRLQLNAVNARIDNFWVEFNASENYMPPDRGPLIAYVRNIVMMRDVLNPTALMQRPNAGVPLPPLPPPPQRPAAPRNLRIIPPPPK